MKRPLFTLMAFLVTTAFSAVPEPKVALVLIDGVRALELEGKAKDDGGKTVPADTIFANLVRLRKQGIYFSEMRVSNPVGISLPAYADIFAGRRQEKILDNEPAPAEFRSHSPTLFELLAPRLGGAVGLFSSWSPLCRIAVSRVSTEGLPFFSSCGWAEGHGFKPEVFAGSRTDSDTFTHLMAELPRRRPRFFFVHLGDADEEAHLHEKVKRTNGGHYGIFHYHQALRQSDYYVGRLWDFLQKDPYYKDSTYLLVATDHGRERHQWWDHGECSEGGKKPLCDSCRRVFLVAAGPGLKPAVVKKPYSHVDLAPTVTRIFGVGMPTAAGKPIPELAP